MNFPVIVIHGGAGTIPKNSLTPEQETAYLQELQTVVDITFAEMEKGMPALDAVELAVKMLEDCPLFNAGKGSVFNHKGTHEMDASIMCGKTGLAGAVGGVSGIRNPVSLARMVMDSDHVFLSGEGALEYATEKGVTRMPEDYFYNEYRHQQWLETQKTGGTRMDHSQPGEIKSGTVGAVALDLSGNLAAATSTGGMTNKKFGRVGDTPIIGAGNYAENGCCAVSCTGHGEKFILSVVAYDIASQIKYGAKDLKSACEYTVLDRLPAINGEGGIIAIDAKGNFELCFNSEGMYRAYKTASESGAFIYR